MFRWLVFLFSITTASICLAQESVANDVRDPTTPLGPAISSSAEGATAWVLNSVLAGAKRKLAVINGKTLREGETIPESNAIKVQRILPQSVILQQGEKTWVLNISPGVIKRN